MEVTVQIFLCLFALFTYFDLSSPKKLDDIDGNDAKEAIDVLDGLLDMLGGSESCEYTCPNGVKPIPNTYHKPTSNGCGSFGVEIKSDSIPGMTECCNKHDICYDTCNSDRKKCDLDFQSCLEKMCEDLKPKLNEQNYQECKGTAALMYSGSKNMGCKAYKDSQKNACSCIPSLEELEHFEGDDDDDDDDDVKEPKKDSKRTEL